MRHAGGPAVDPAELARREVDRLVSKRKREILERECFGLVEFVEPAHGFDVVGGMDEVKKDLLVIAESIREGRTSRVPMGLLFTGPHGHRARPSSPRRSRRNARCRRSS